MAHAGGRPPKYKSADEITGLIEAYFDGCAGEYRKDLDGNYIMDRHGRPVIIGRRPPTMSGLALALGFANRRSLTAYQGKAEFRDVITIAKSRVEMYTEERLFDRDGAEGAKFSLRNNFKWGLNTEPEAQSYTVITIRE